MKTKERKSCGLPPSFSFLFCRQKKLKNPFSLLTSILLYLPTPTASSVFNEARFSCVCVDLRLLTNTLDFHHLNYYTRPCHSLLCPFDCKFLLFIEWKEFKKLNLIFSFQFQVDYVLVVTGSAAVAESSRNDDASFMSAPPAPASLGFCHHHGNRRWYLFVHFLFLFIMKKMATDRPN